MSSSVFFRFKSQKEPSRVTFDGTGISVFELKREIITLSRLGDGTDFEIIITSEDSSEVYDDDTTIIPRSTTVIAKRLPAIKAGRGGAARYVSGKMPVNARNSHRLEIPSAKTNGKSQQLSNSNAVSNISELKTEEERIAAMFKLGAENWEQQQQEMANATPIHRGGTMKGKPKDVPDHPPPSGYVCYRCGEKGHWINSCPTNDDPKFDNRPRIKRTTGIPKSFLKTVEKPTALLNDGTLDDSKKPLGVMVNAEGEWVIAEPDQAAWEQFQNKAKVSATAQEAAARGNKELQDRGLECSIDRRLFVEPTRTPCCKKTYCNECITNALLDNDLQCPDCEENVLIDDLIPDTDKMAEIRSYEEEKKAVKREIEIAKSPLAKQEASVGNADVRPKSKSPSAVQESSKSASTPVTDGIPRKRSAETELENDRVPPGPNGVRSTVESTKASQQTTPRQATIFPPDFNFLAQVPYSNPGFIPSVTAPMGISMSMGPMDMMMASMMNPMMMPNFGVTNGMGNWGSMDSTAFPQYSSPSGGSYNNGMTPGFGFAPAYAPPPTGNRNLGMNGRAPFNRGGGSFANQQRTTFSSHQPSQEESPYFRMPVNPHRHQGRRNVSRPADYREI